MAAQSGEGVAVAGGGGVGRNVEGGGDLGEGQLTPDFEGEHFALFGGQVGKGGGKLVAAFGGFERAGERLDERPGGGLFAGDAAVVLAGLVDGGLANEAEGEAGRDGSRVGELAPEADEALLESILGIGLRLALLAGIKQEAGSPGAEPSSPRVVVRGRGFHEGVSIDECVAEARICLKFFFSWKWRGAISACAFNPP